MSVFMASVLLNMVPELERTDWVVVGAVNPGFGGEPRRAYSDGLCDQEQYRR